MHDQERADNLGEAKVCADHGRRLGVSESYSHTRCIAGGGMNYQGQGNVFLDLYEISFLHLDHLYLALTCPTNSFHYTAAFDSVSEA